MAQSPSVQETEVLESEEYYARFENEVLHDTSNSILFNRPSVMAIDGGNLLYYLDIGDSNVKPKAIYLKRLSRWKACLPGPFEVDADYWETLADTVAPGDLEELWRQQKAGTRLDTEAAP